MTSKQPEALQYADRAMRAAQQGAAYAELPDQIAWRDSTYHCDLYYQPTYREGLAPLFTADQMRDFADRTNALRASHGQVPAETVLINGLTAEETFATVSCSALTEPRPGAAYAAMSKDVIREIFMAHGFTVKEGQTDLKEYVYDAAEALLQRASHGQAPAQPAPQQDAQEPVALLVRKNSWRAGQWEAAPPDYPSYGLTWANQRQYVYAAPHPSPAAQGDALDAARYRFLRDGEWRDTDLEPFIRLQLNTLWDAKIDAARAAQEGA